MTGLSPAHQAIALIESERIEIRDKENLKELLDNVTDLMDQGKLEELKEKDTFIEELAEQMGARLANPAAHRPFLRSLAQSIHELLYIQGMKMLLGPGGIVRQEPYLIDANNWIDSEGKMDEQMMRVVKALADSLNQSAGGFAVLMPAAHAKKPSVAFLRDQGIKLIIVEEGDKLQDIKRKMVEIGMRNDAFVLTVKAEGQALGWAKEGIENPNGEYSNSSFSILDKAYNGGQGLGMVSTYLLFATRRLAKERHEGQRVVAVGNFDGQDEMIQLFKDYGIRPIHAIWEFLKEMVRSITTTATAA